MRRRAVLCEQQPWDPYGRIPMEWPRMKVFEKTTPQEVKSKIKFGAILLAAAAFLAGCSGFWDAPASGGGGTTTTTLSSGYFYVLDKANSEVLPYYINAGTLTLGSSISLPAAPIAITVAPNNDFLYVSTLSGIYLYSISGGALSLGNSKLAITSDPAVVMQVDATGSWLVETSGTGTLNAIPIVSTTGLINTGSSCVTNQSPACTVTLNPTTVDQLAIASNGDNISISSNTEFVFVACGTSGTAAFGFNPAGSDPFGNASGPYVTENPVTSTTGAALAVAVDPTNSLLYVGEAAAVSSSGGLRVFTIDATSGSLAEQTKEGSPYASGGSGPHAILPNPAGDDVFVANWNGTNTGNITGFSITSSNSTYSLTELKNQATTGIEPESLVEDSRGNFVLVESSGGNPYLSAYIFDTTTAGELDLTNTSTNYAGIALAANQ